MPEHMREKNDTHHQQKDSIETQHQAEPEQVIADRISAVFESEQLWDACKKRLDQKNSGFSRNAVGEVLDYFVLDPEGTYFAIFLDNTMSFQEQMIHIAARQLGIEDLSTDHAQKRIAAHIHTRCFKEGYAYHAFNGVFLDDILEHGLDPHRRIWDWSDLDQMDELVGVGMFTGMANINSKGVIFYATKTKVIDLYGLRSPEWFSTFVGANAFITRNHHKAKEYVTIQCNNYTNQHTRAHLTSEEKEKVLAFFEKYWHMFCGEKSTPMVAKFKNKIIKQDELGYTYDLFLEDNENVSDLDKLKTYLGVAYNMRSLHGETAKNILPQHLSIIRLPPL
jgi:hypothetical protein